MDAIASRQTLGDRLDATAWGLLAILLGVLALPSGMPTHLLAMAVGAGLLAVNVARLVRGLAIRWLSSVLGAVVLAAGAAATVGVEVDVFAAFFIALGSVAIGVALLGSRPTTA